MPNKKKKNTKSNSKFSLEIVIPKLGFFWIICEHDLYQGIGGHNAEVMQQ